MAGEPPPQTPHPSPGRSWLRIALLASLALNLAVVGLFAGLAFSGSRDGARAPAGLVSYARALPEPHRRQLMHAIRATEGDWREERRRLAETSREFRAAVIAEPFEPERLHAVLAGQRQAQDALAARGAALLVERIARMSPEERRSFAATLERRAERGPPRLRE